jgi:hypothetical protein
VDQPTFFSLSLDQSRSRLIGHLADFLSVFPLYAQGERAGEFAGEAGAMMLVHAAVASGEIENNLLTSHLFLAGTSLLAFSNLPLFAHTLLDAQSAQETKQWLNQFADGIAAHEALPLDEPILSAPDQSFDFLDCAALGALHKCLEALEVSLPLAVEIKTHIDLGVVLLETAIAYDLHMGHVDHALAAWASLAILATIDVPLPRSASIPYQYRRLLVTYLRSLADSYGLTKDFAYLFN